MFTLPVLLVLSPGVTCEIVSGIAVLSFVLSSTEVEPPGVMISASAVGYYGSSGGCHGELDAPEADSFLAAACVAR